MSSTVMALSDQSEIERLAHLVIEPGSVAELRIPKAGRAGTVSGYFDDPAAFVKAGARWSGKAPGVYVTLNPCNPALLARSQNRMKQRVDATTSDADIVKRRWLPFDFDPVRPAGISSDEVEHQAALARAQACRSWLATLGWPEPVYADSGNGAHLLYRIDLPSDDASRALIQHVLHALALHFSDDEVTLDEAVCNAARIWKVYGTLSCKGDNIPERPHRLARILEAPLHPTIVSQELLTDLAAMVPEQPQTARDVRSPGHTEFDLDAWITEHGLSVLREGEWGSGGRKWLLNPCPWNADHADRAAYIVQFANGAIAAGCHHNSCTGKGWADLRDLYEPDWRQRREAWGARQTQAVNGAARVAQVAGVAAAPSQPRIPDPLRREVPSPEPYPVDAMGSLLAAITHRLIDVVQAPDAICAQSVLAAATLAVQAQRDVAIDGRTYPLSEYYLTLGESGERKTAADSRALWPHREREYALVTQHDEDSLRFENDRDAYKKSREDILRKEKNHTARKVALDLLGSPPVGPLKPLLTTSEPTYEGLVRLLAEGQPSVGLFSNEGGRLIGGHGMNQENQLKTAAGLSEIWDGQRIDRVRGGDGATALYGRRLTMHLMMQPAVAHLLLGNALLLEQGVLSRCLVAFPDTTAGTRLYKAIDLSQDLDVKRYNAAMLNILKMALPLAEGKRNELNPPALTLDAGAKQVWAAFHDHVERQLAPNGPLESIRSFASKAAEHALRLSGVLTLVDDVHAQQIHKAGLEAAIELVEFYIGEALRLYGAAATDPDLIQAETLLAWAQQHDTIYLRQIYRLGPNRIRDAKTAKRLVAILEEHGWLIRVDGGMKVDGAHRQDVWSVYR